MCNHHVVRQQKPEIFVFTKLLRAEHRVTKTKRFFLEGVVKLGKAVNIFYDLC